jgi:hypothetical protein
MKKVSSTLIAFIFVALVFSCQENQTDKLITVKPD